MKKLSPKPKSQLINKMTKPLLISTTVITSMTACIKEVDPGEQYTEAGDPGEQYTGAGVPYSGDDFVGAGDPNVDYYHRLVPLDIGLEAAGSEAYDMTALDSGTQDFGVVDMESSQPDAQLDVGLPSERDSAIDEPGREEP
jgi:hypothetical protein